MMPHATDVKTAKETASCTMTRRKRGARAPSPAASGALAAGIGRGRIIPSVSTVLRDAECPRRGASDCGRGHPRSPFSFVLRSFAFQRYRPRLDEQTHDTPPEQNRPRKPQRHRHRRRTRHWLCDRHAAAAIGSQRFALGCGCHGTRTGCGEIETARHRSHNSRGCDELGIR